MCQPSPQIPGGDPCDWSKKNFACYAAPEGQRDLKGKKAAHFRQYMATCLLALTWARSRYHTVTWLILYYMSWSRMQTPGSGSIFVSRAGSQVDASVPNFEAIAHPSLPTNQSFVNTATPACCTCMTQCVHTMAKHMLRSTGQREIMRQHSKMKHAPEESNSERGPSRWDEVVNLDHSSTCP